MVTLAGQAILEGKHLSEGGVTPRAWTHFIIALLCHDIGYVKGICADDDAHKDTAGFAGLVRAADFIGQLADPNRMQKCTNLFFEFEELGINKKLGYRTPGDLRACNAQFYWDVAKPYVQDALQYLKVTHEGKQWIANLQSNVFGSDQGEDFRPDAGKKSL